MGRYEEAIPDFLTFLKGREIVREDIMIQYHFACCLKETEQYEAAKEIIEAILAMKPDHFQTLVLKGELLMSEGKETEVV